MCLQLVRSLPLAAAIGYVGKQGEECKVKRGVRGDGDAQEPSESPGHRFMSFRHDEFGELEAGREKSNQRRRDLRLDRHGNRQSEKA